MATEEVVEASEVDAEDTAVAVVDSEEEETSLEVAILTSEVKNPEPEDSALEEEELTSSNSNHYKLTPNSKLTLGTY